jgi:hypothetical protein
MKLSILSTVTTVTIWLFAVTANSADPIDVDALASNDMMDMKMETLDGVHEDTGRNLALSGDDIDINAASIDGNVAAVDEQDTPSSLNPFRRLLGGFGNVRGLRGLGALPPPPNYYPGPAIWYRGPSTKVYGDDIYAPQIHMRKKKGRFSRKLMVDPEE